MSHLLGVDLGGTNTKLVRLDGDGTVRESRQWENGSATPEQWIEQCREHLSGWAAEDATCLGLSVAGLVGASRRIENAPNLRSFEQFDFVGAFAGIWPDLEVELENDVHCAVFGESRAGVARGFSHVLMLSLGTGVGGGAIVDGKLFRGSRGMGAEFGHTLLNCDGPVCKCGLPGHVEAYLGAEAIAARIQQAASADSERGAALRVSGSVDGYSAALLSALAQRGDPLACELWEELGGWLGLAFANLSHAFNPEMCVVGGGVAEAGELLLEPARRSLRAKRMRAESLECELRAAALGPLGAAIGAALLARERVAGAESR